MLISGYKCIFFSSLEAFFLAHLVCRVHCQLALVVPYTSRSLEVLGLLLVASYYLLSVTQALLDAIVIA